jgi:hypothetical protein
MGLCHVAFVATRAHFVSEALRHRVWGLALVPLAGEGHAWVLHLDPAPAGIEVAVLLKQWPCCPGDAQDTDHCLLSCSASVSSSVMGYKGIQPENNCKIQ